MRLVELVGSTTFMIEYRGKRWNFEKSKVKEVPSDLADKLLATGDFVDVIRDDPAFGGVITTPTPLVLNDSEDIVVPLDSVRDSVKDFNKLEVAVDLKKEDETSLKEVGQKVEKVIRRRRRKKESS